MSKALVTFCNMAVRETLRGHERHIGSFLVPEGSWVPESTYTDDLAAMQF
jgi:hypothetical protein